MIEVAAAIIEKQGKILIGKRRGSGSCAGLWEFPGGKQEPGETLPEALRRECREELGIAVSVGGLCARIVHQYPDREVGLSFFYAMAEDGVPENRVHEELRWAEPEELARLPFCPADTELAASLAAAYGLRPGRYRHYKGKEYQLLTLARHSETLEPMAVYQALYGEGDVWVRPARMFVEIVMKGGKSFPRFVRMGEISENSGV